VLDDRIILVTNVTHFVGLPSAREMAAQGARVICHDSSFTDPSVRDAFAAKNPGLKPLSATEPEETVQAVTGEFGRLDVLINNDAAPAIRAALENASLDDLRSGLEEMVVAPFAFSAAAVGDMKQRKRGKILFITSATTFRGLPNYSMYVAGRGAANALALSLAKELAPSNIQVNAIAPNYVESPTYFPDSLLSNPDALAKITRNIPLGRLGKPDEVAKVVAFFASDASDFITGHVLPIAGGWA
jgi:NAD(P)-dependent dehydrogenase (short-subunit alcohol dehydrogenase family)